MKVMLTLFHHSLPPWAGEYGGWKLEKTVDYFVDFTSSVTYCAGTWPGGNPDMLEVATSALPTGEVVSGTGLKLVETDEYSESGWAVYPDGLYRMLLQFHDRYKHLNVPFIVTENGVSDEIDLIRRPYMLEHLLAIYAAMIMV
ncbi:hypothetical protein TEA_000675 [Camellia sinensis var. sinensis]|uniref:Beta-glucosidase n=1 Tax=Camellia sinensis var. sinensis TaxID=542762 RepID=A0A4S4D691_CAMSN|nr:hypothetical protein TEA_000675 [Camellia sinensis var. sinensis]